jgi:hypothetical protein
MSAYQDQSPEEVRWKHYQSMGPSGAGAPPALVVPVTPSFSNPLGAVFVFNGPVFCFLTQPADASSYPATPSSQIYSTPSKPPDAPNAFQPSGSQSAVLFSNPTPAFGSSSASSVPVFGGGQSTAGVIASTPMSTFGAAPSASGVCVPFSFCPSLARSRMLTPVLRPDSVRWPALH